MGRRRLAAMQVPLSKILNLLEPTNDVEVRRAVLTVLGEIGQRTGDVPDAVVAALADEDAEVRLRAIAAAGKLRVEKALPLLTERIKSGGTEAVQAAEVAARLGAKGRKHLHELMPQVAPGLRRYIASALAGAGAAGSGDVKELEVLLDKDPGVVESTVKSLAAAIPTLDARRKQAIADELIRLAGDRQTVLSPATESAIVRLAGLLDDDRVAPLLWDRVLPPHSHEARASALAALSKWVQSPTKEQRHRLFVCAAEPDFRVAAPALMILDRLPVTDKTVAEWLPLFRSPGLAGRRLALAKVGDRDSDEVAETLVGQLGHPDRAFRDDVLDRLSRTERGRKALAERLASADTADAAWPLARVLARLHRTTRRRGRRNSSRKRPGTWSPETGGLNPCFSSSAKAAPRCCANVSRNGRQRWLRRRHSRPPIWFIVPWRAIRRPASPTGWSWRFADSRCRPGS